MTVRTQEVGQRRERLPKPMKDRKQPSAQAPGSALTAASKQPYYIQYHHHDLFAFAGLWEHWNREQEEIYSCTIITTDANETVKSIHNRMPAVIEPEYYDVWLDPEHQDTSDLQDILKPHDGDFKAYPISTRLNNPANDDAGCIERLEY